MIYKILITFLFVQGIQAASLDNIKTYNWNGVEVLHLVDNRYPTYDLAVYFADGALSDGKIKGLSSATLNGLSFGTRRYTQKDIADNLEFFAVSHSASINHEYSLYTVSGLVKDIKPTMKKICHLFTDASFPKRELAKEKRRARQARKDIINSKGALASMIARELSLKGNIIILCGHYKGVDQRVRDAFVTREISIGDFVLSGGELAAAVLCDSVIRLLPGVLNNETSALTDSFQDNLLAPPIYTRPAEYKGMKVPDILLSGHTAKIEEWREDQALEHTQKRRPDLLDEND